jgi:hypothetical protein
LSDRGFLKYQAALVNLEDAAFYIRNHADDLRLDDDIVEALMKIEFVANQLSNVNEFDSE